MSEVLQQVMKALEALWAFVLDVCDDTAAAYRNLQPIWKTVVWAGGLAVLGVVLWWALSPSAVAVQMNVRHPFRHAQMTVTIDGTQAYTGDLNGQPTKKLLVLQRIEGSFHREFSLAPGTHSVQVHILSQANAYDQQVQRTIDAAAGRGGTLSVMAQNGADLAMSWQPVAAAGEGGRMPAFLTTLNSIVLTLLGTILSATIGFFVQEYLKAKRQKALSS